CHRLRCLMIIDFTSTGYGDSDGNICRFVGCLMVGSYAWHTLRGTDKLFTLVKLRFQRCSRSLGEQCLERVYHTIDVVLLHKGVAICVLTATKGRGVLYSHSRNT